MSEEKSRWEEIRQIWVESATAYRILGAIGLVVFGALLGKNLFENDAGYNINLYTELLGVVLSVVMTVFVIDVMNRRRDERRRQEELKKSLLLEVRSPDALEARKAIHRLNQYGWLQGENGVLRDIYLPRNKLGRVDLKLANLSNSYLYGSDLSGSSFAGATLDNSVLQNANLAGCHFNGAKMRNVDLENANLRNASLVNVDFRGANLKNANLENTLIYSSVSVFNSSNLQFEDKSQDSRYQTILPDESVAMPNTDMKRFSDPGRPDFWNSKDLDSPAHPENDVFTRWFKSIQKFPEQ